MVAALLIVDSHGTSSTLQRILPNNLPGVLQLDVWGGGCTIMCFSHNAQSEAV